MQMLPALVVAAVAMAAALPDSRAQEPQPDLVTVVTSAEPQTQLMAFVLTAQAREQGARVRVLLCGPGGDIALEDAPETATAPQEPQGMSPQALMLRLAGAGVPVEVCALYLPNKGVGPEALLEGVGTALPPDMAAAMLAPNTRLLTF
jgi:hypothetical protein